MLTRWPRLVALCTVHCAFFLLKKRKGALFKRKRAQNRRKKGSFQSKKAQKNPRSATFVPRENAREGVAVHLLHDLPILPPPPPPPLLAPPLQDFQEVRGRFKEGCLNRLRRSGHARGVDETETNRFATSRNIHPVQQTWLGCDLSTSGARKRSRM